MSRSESAKGGKFSLEEILEAYDFSRTLIGTLPLEEIREIAAHKEKCRENFPVGKFSIKPRVALVQMFCNAHVIRAEK